MLGEERPDKFDFSWEIELKYILTAAREFYGLAGTQTLGVLRIKNTKKLTLVFINRLHFDKRTLRFSI